MENSDTLEPSDDIPTEAFKYWIHCNYCYSFYFKKEDVIYLLSCHHILCQKCLTAQSNAVEVPSASKKTDLTYKCIMCSRMARVRKIGNELPSHLKELFHPQPWLADLSAERVYKFQSKHREHLMKAMASLETKALRKDQMLLEKMELNKKMEEQLLKQKHENMKLERRVRPMLEVYKQRKMLEAQQRRVVANANVSISSGEPTIQIRSYPNQNVPTNIANESVYNGARPSFGSTKISAQQNVSNVMSFVNILPKKSFDL